MPGEGVEAAGGQEDYPAYRTILMLVGVRARVVRVYIIPLFRPSRFDKKESSHRALEVANAAREPSGRENVESHCPEIYPKAEAHNTQEFHNKSIP